MRTTVYILITCTLLLTSCMARKKSLSKTQDAVAASVDSSTSTVLLQEQISMSLLDTTILVPADTAFIKGSHVFTGNEAIDTCWEESQVKSGSVTLRVKSRTRPNTSGRVTDIDVQAIKDLEQIAAKILQFQSSKTHAAQNTQVSQSVTASRKEEDLNAFKWAFKPGFSLISIAAILLLVIALIIIKKTSF